LIFTSVLYSCQRFGFAGAEIDIVPHVLRENGTGRQKPLLKNFKKNE